MSRPVLVTGGTGTTGSRAARQLTERGVESRVAYRYGPTPFDWLKPGTWPPAEQVERDLDGFAWLAAAGDPTMTTVVEQLTGRAPQRLENWLVAADRSGVWRA